MARIMCWCVRMGIASSQSSHWYSNIYFSPSPPLSSHFHHELLFHPGLKDQNGGSHNHKSQISEWMFEIENYSKAFGLVMAVPEKGWLSTKLLSSLSPLWLNLTIFTLELKWIANHQSFEFWLLSPDFSIFCPISLFYCCPCPFLSVLARETERI